MLNYQSGSMIILYFCAVVLCLLRAGVAEEPTFPQYYIYDWPKEFGDVYPAPNTTLHAESSYSHDFYENKGAGKLLNPDVGLFQTWQFSLYKNVMSRLYISKFRTKDPAKAVAFIIPFDAGVHSYIDHVNGRPRLASPHGWPVQRWLQEARKSPIFWKNNGHDHFIFFSITVYQMVGIGVKTFFMNICQNCTAVTIETSPTRTAISGRSKKYWYAAPYPSSFHWWEGIKELPWKVTDELASQRTILSLFIGSVRTANQENNAFRKMLFAQCENEEKCEWHKTAHACNGVVNATSQMMQFRKAQFCPAPAGDSITRKSIFDSLVTGCVPVIFARASLSQYIWWISEKEIDEVSVYIPKQSILENGVNFIDVIKAITPEELRKKQLAIEKLAPKLQYGVVPKRYASDYDLTHTGDSVWDPPIFDANDVIIQKILDRKTIEPINGFTPDELLRQKCLQVDIMQNHADYAGLFPGKTGGKAGAHISTRVWSKNKCGNFDRAGFNGSTFSVDWR